MWADVPATIEPVLAASAMTPAVRSSLQCARLTGSLQQYDCSANPRFDSISTQLGKSLRTPDGEGQIIRKLQVNAVTGKRCRLRRSTQHLLGVYSLEFEILEFFLDVDSSAARPGRAALE